MNTSTLTVIHNCQSWLPQTQTWLYNQVRYLPQEIESHIICETTQNLDQFALPNIHALENAPKYCQIWNHGLRKLKLRRYLGFGIPIAKRHQAPVLHSHFGDVGWVYLGFAKQAQLKYVVTFYGFDVNYIPTQNDRWRQRYQTLFQQADRILCEGSHMAKCIVQLGCPADKVLVHHLGIPVQSIAFKPRTWQPGEPLRVLIAASFSEKKGIPYALEALGKLQHEVPLEITLIGDAADTPILRQERQKIFAAIENYKLQSKISLLGYQPHTTLFAEAYRHHIFLSPSVTASTGDTEGGAPVSLIEMAATGMPIVSTTHCDIPEVIKHGITGLLAPERDVDTLVEHLRWWVNHPDRWYDMLAAGRQHIEKEYDAEVQGQRLAAIYRSLLD